MTPHAIRVFDDVVPLPDDYRAAALLRDFHDMAAGDEWLMHGISEVGPTPLSMLIEQEYPSLKVTTSFFRLSPEGQAEPNYVHTDADMGQWSGVLYLNPDPPATDGTAFWRRRSNGDIQTPWTDPLERRMEGHDWRDLHLWETWFTVRAAYNRLVLFPSAYYHSRAIEQNWGEGKEARLIQMVFATGTMPCV